MGQLEREGLHEDQRFELFRNAESRDSMPYILQYYCSSSVHQPATLGTTSVSLLGVRILRHCLVVT